MTVAAVVATRTTTGANVRASARHVWGGIGGFGGGGHSAWVVHARGACRASRVRVSWTLVYVGVSEREGRMGVVILKDVKVVMVRWDTCIVAAVARYVVAGVVAVVELVAAFGVVVVAVEKTTLANVVLALGAYTVGSGPQMGIELDLVVAGVVDGDNSAPFLVRVTLRVAVAAHTAGCRRALGRHTWPSCRRNRATGTTLETNTALSLHHYQKKRSLDLTTNSMRTRTMMMKQDPDRD